MIGIVIFLLFDFLAMRRISAKREILARSYGGGKIRFWTTGKWGVWFRKKVNNIGKHFTGKRSSINSVAFPFYGLDCQ